MLEICVNDSIAERQFELSPLFLLCGFFVAISSVHLGRPGPRPKQLVDHPESDPYPDFDLYWQLLPYYSVMAGDRLGIANRPKSPQSSAR